MKKKIAIMLSAAIVINSALSNPAKSGIVYAEENTALFGR